MLLFKSEFSIDLEAIATNLKYMMDLHPHAKFLPTVKDNAYGFGAVPVANVCQQVLKDRLYGLGVAFMEEALILRKNGFTAPILLLSGVFSEHEVELALHHDLHVVICSIEQLDFCCNVTKSKDKKLPVWLKIDTGLNRLGILPKDVDRALSLIEDCDHISIEVVMTHMQDAENDPLLSRRQFDMFNATMDRLQRISFQPNMVSLFNSSALLNPLMDWNQAVSNQILRPGISLYGMFNSGEIQAAHSNMKRAYAFTAPVIHTKEVQNGECIGYGKHFCATKDSRIAILRAGYGHGLPRVLKPEAYVMIRGIKCPIVGVVSMDLMAVDITQCPGTLIGDRAELFGDTISIETFAHWANTVPSDITVHIHQDYVERSYLKN